MRVRLSFFAVLLSLSSTPHLWSQERSQAKPQLAAFPRLEFRKWSGEINVPDPVAVSVDSQGRVYATQTKRRKIQDLDIRSHSEWIPDDVGLQSIAEKREFLKHKLAIGGDDVEQATHVDDHNQDGVHDWRDLTVVSEVIFCLTDTDGDGTADAKTVFAEDFKTEVTGIAAGVLAFNGDVYATIAPDLWKLRDIDDDGVADRRKSIAHGFGHHIAYAGHDMHGPTVGPDGKIYWSIGDKGINVTTGDGRSIAYPNEGGVLRCNPDGSDFEVFAHGLRNVQEFAFDQYGNMFGVDNDADMTRERERFVYIVDAMDAGWRSNYQYRGDEYNPWMAERLWELPGEQHAAYIIPPLQHYIDGPAGFKFNPGTAISPAYKDFFFVTGAPEGRQHAFRVAPEGDAYKMVDEHQIGAGLAIVGLAFGPDGGLYGADWDGGYPLDEIGSIVRIDAANANRSAVRLEVEQRLKAGFSDLSVPALRGFLSHADQRIRQGAQFALVDRDAGDVLADVAGSDSADLLARLHSLWGLGQLTRSGDTARRDTIDSLLNAKDPILRGQAAKTYGELRKVDGTPLIDLLDDPDLHVRTLAGLALARQPTDKAVARLFEQADVLTDGQHYLRHSIVIALAACADAEQLLAQADHRNENRRLSAALALRSQGHPAVATYLNDTSDRVATEAARAIHDDESIAEALPALAAALVGRDSPTTAFAVRAINANFRLGDTAASHRLLNFALDDRNSEDLRLVALESLAQWMTPPVLDRVEGRRRDLPIPDRQVETDALVAGFAKLTNSTDERLRTATLVAARRLNILLPDEVLLAVANDDENAPATRIEAFTSLAERLTAKGRDAASDAFAQDLRTALLKTLEADSQEVQIRSVELLSELYPQQSLDLLTRVVTDDFGTPVKQAAIAALATLPDSSGGEAVRSLAVELAADKLDPALALDVRDALAQFPELVGQVPLATDKFVYSRDGGDVERGRRLFNTHVTAQCTRCHKTGREGSTIGPELTKIASTRDPDYLLRAIVQPSADIDPKYRLQLLLLSSGEVVKGLVQSQNDEETIVADSTGVILTLETEDIEGIREQTVSPMPEMTEVLTALEVRDLVAYLRSLR